MENRTKELKKQCPICGTLIDENVDYCPECDSYVGDVAPMDDSVRPKTIEENPTHNSDFDNLDTILSDNQESKNQITLEDLQNLLAGNQGQVFHEEEQATKLPKRTEVKKRRHRGQEEVNKPEKIIIDTQPVESDDYYEFEEKSVEEREPDTSNHRDNFFRELLFYNVESLAHPSIKASAMDFWQAIISLAAEFVFTIFSVQLLYNSGFQMVTKKTNPNFGNFLINGLTIGKKYSVIWPLLILLGIYVLIIGFGLIFDKFLVRDDHFSSEKMVAQIVRYSSCLIPISILMFIYSLFNNPLVTKITLMLICLIPIFLTIAVSLSLIQAKGQVLFDRVYIILLYNVVSLLGSYLLIRPYILSFAQAFSQFIGTK